MGKGTVTGIEERVTSDEVRRQLVGKLCRAWKNNVHRSLVELRTGTLILEGNLAMFIRNINAYSFSANSSPSRNLSFGSQCAQADICARTFTAVWLIVAKN